MATPRPTPEKPSDPKPAQPIAEPERPGRRPRPDHELPDEEGPTFPTPPAPGSPGHPI